MNKGSRILLASLSLVVLSGANECPITMGPEQAADAPAGGAEGTALDLGGQGGALWQVSFAQEVTVTLRAGGQAASEKVALPGGVVALPGGSIDLASFCWRSDVVCPQQVLPWRTVLAQPTEQPGMVLSSFNPRGPLWLYREAGALGGQLDGAELAIPLSGGQEAAGFCGLGPASMILGTVSASSEQAERGELIQGRVTVSYSGTCLNLGSGSVETDAQVELSVGYAAQRE